MYNKCQRCRRYTPEVGLCYVWYDLCLRCANVLETMFEKGFLYGIDKNLFEYRKKFISQQEILIKGEKKIGFILEKTK